MKHLLMAALLLSVSACGLRLETASGFIERHWWQIIIIYGLIALGFAYKEEDRTGGAVVFFLGAAGYLVYCLYGRYPLQ